MWLVQIVVFISISVILVAAKRDVLRGHTESQPETNPTNIRRNKNWNDLHTPPSTKRFVVGEAVVEKFVETLMASERYLRMVEAVERKLSHLDTIFHERSITILKYLSEILRAIKTSPTEVLESAMKTVKTDLDKLRQSVTERYDVQHPSMRVEGTEYHGDTPLETRLGFLEGQVKTILGGVDSIVATISEVKNRQITRTNKPEFGSTLDATALINEFRRTLHEQKSKKCDCRAGRVERSERYPTDCHEIQMQGFNISGIYKIRPDDMDPFYVLCDLTTSGGGWTVFQNRFDGTQDFYKSWSDYKYGFGNLAGEFWLGLEKLNYLTNQKLYELRIEIETQHGQEAYASFSVFTIGPEYEGYRISTLGTFFGTAGDSLTYHAGQKFSTFDMDNDEWKDGACATEHGGAWWYKECDKSNLNGKYSILADENRGQAIYWISFKGPTFPIVKTKMMIRPLPASKPIDFESSRKLLESPALIRQDKKKRIYATHGHSSYQYEEPAKAEPFFPYL